MELKKKRIKTYNLKEKKNIYIYIYIKRHSKQLKEKIYIFIYIKRQSKLCTTSSVKT